MVGNQQQATLPVAGNPQATQSAATMPAPAAATPGQTPAVTAGGNPMVAGGPAPGRGEGLAAAHGHTVASATRRPGGDPRSGLPRWLANVLPGHTASRSRDQSAEERADRTFQGLYWLLAVTAYASLAFTVIILVPLLGGSGTTLVPAGSSRPLAGLFGFAALGFATGIGAWLLARRTR